MFTGLADTRALLVSQTNGERMAHVGFIAEQRGIYTEYNGKFKDETSATMSDNRGQLQAAADEKYNILVDSDATDEIELLENFVYDLARD
jgi:hypothetical protein